jgi:hypothetical protein
MFTRVLTEHERRKIKAFLKANGERDVLIRTLIMRTRKYERQIRDDLALLELLRKKYDETKKWPRATRKP